METSTVEDKDSDEEVGTLKDSYPYYGDGSGRSEPMTIRSVRIRDPTEADSDLTSSGSGPKEPKKKGLFSQPKGTMEYTVTATDKLETIALAHDSTRTQLMRLNHLSSSMIFPGQKLYVPDPNSKEPLVLSPTNKTFPSQEQNSFSTASSRVDVPTVSMKPKPPDVPVVKPADRPKKNRLFMRSKSKDEEGGGTRERRQKYRKKAVKKQNSTPIPGRVIRQSTQDSDTDESSKQFLKLDVKYITDGEGVVSGTMLVTPNAIMFDPNVSDPLVIERGVSSYGVITQMDIVVGASMYHDISAMSLKAQAGASAAPTCPVYIPGEDKKDKTENKSSDNAKNENGTSPSLPAQEDVQETMQGSSMEDNKLCEEKQQQTIEGGQEAGSLEVKAQNGESPQNGDTSLVDKDSCETENLLSEKSKSHEDDDVFKLVSEEADSTQSQEKFPNDIAMKEEDGGSVEENVQLSSDKRLNEMDNRDDERILTRGGDEGEDKVTMEHEEKQGSGDDTLTCQEEKLDLEETEDFQDQNHPSLCDGDEKFLKSDSNLAKVEEKDETIDSTQEKQDSETLEKDLPHPQPQSTLAEDNSKTETEENQAFVNFSSGLFVTDKRKCSMVADMSECVLDNSMTEKEMAEVEVGRLELKRLSEEEIVKEKKWIKDEIIEESLSRGGSISSDDVSSNKSEEKRGKSSQGSVKLVYTTKDFEEFRPRLAKRYEDPPLYLCLKVYRPMQKTFERQELNEDGDEDPSLRRKKLQKSEKLPEYWFAIPREKADNLYNFFLQWSPEKYGKEVSPDELGFVPVEQTESMVEVVEDFFSEPISKDWEIVSKEEANRRRMTLLECEMDLPLPQLLGESRLLDATHIGKLRKELPPRTEGYNWSLIYNTASDGFSLQSLYRTMQDWECPVLLLLEDSSNYLFGALVSCPLKESDAYYGTGETFLFQFESDDEYTNLVCYRWTGENMYFIKGDRDSISIGGGEGTIGLWLDGDLYHGRCRKCKTFDNAILSGTEDFVIKNLEVWGFVM